MDNLQLKRSRRRHRRLRADRIILIVILIVAVVMLGVLAVGKINSGNTNDDNSANRDKQNGAGNSDSTHSDSGNSDGNGTDGGEDKEKVEFVAKAVEGTRPEDFNFTYEIEVDGEAVSSYNAAEPFYFGSGDDYTDLQGVISFRGNSFRNGGSYGSISGLDVKYDTSGKPIWGNILEDEWSVTTYSLKKGNGGSYSGSWTGSGWTGQPIIVKWDRAVKQHMNMNDAAKADDELVEVIYATMDGHIYFINLETGEPTRQTLNMNIPFKGAGSLDPRGYPILYIGAGDSYDREEDFRPAKAMAISLIDYSILYEFGHKPDEFALREWTAYDSSALVCEANDCLIYPGENGILYVMKLNTVYNEATGELSMAPSDLVKLRYTSDKNTQQGFALGYEGSAAAYGSYVFLTENTGLMHCVDLNTMSVVWVQDIKDDTNSSPVFSIESDGCYLYVGNTVDGTVENGKGVTSFYKINAQTGEIVWQIDREIYTDGHITGGVMTSAVLGQQKAEGRVYIVFSSYSDDHGANGTMVCVNTNDGSIIWEGPLSTYAWSSPAPIYDAEGNLYFVQCNCGGNVYLVDGCSDTYEQSIIDKLIVNPATNIEATPAIYGDMIVIGTRVSGIHGIRIKTN